MPKIWVLRGLKKGILTSKYPKIQPTTDEVPSRAHPPLPTDFSNWLYGETVCPTGAIVAQQSQIDLAKCIFCRRCEKAGFNFDDTGTSGVLQSRLATRKSFADDKLKQELERRWNIFYRSMHVLLIDVGSCNACNLEVLNLSNPYYDLQRLGVFFTNSPKHADALIVVGALNGAMVETLKRTYEMMPNPKIVVSVGACALSGGVFQTVEGFVSSVSRVIPVDVEIPGCPPSPIQILQGLLIGMGKIRPSEISHANLREMIPKKEERKE